MRNQLPIVGLQKCAFTSPRREGAGYRSHPYQMHVLAGRRRLCIQSAVRERKLGREAMVTRDQERIQQLRREIAEIQQANDQYLVSMYTNSSALEANEQRRQRLLEIMEELANLARKKSA